MRSKENLDDKLEVQGEDKDIILDFIKKCEEDESYVPSEEELKALERYGLLDDILCEDDEDEEDECIGIDVSTHEVQGLGLSVSEYSKGVKDASYFVGFVSALKSIGYPTKLIHEIILNSQTCESNVKMAKQTVINNDKNSI